MMSPESWLAPQKAGSPGAGNKWINSCQPECSFYETKIWLKTFALLMLLSDVCHIASPQQKTTKNVRNNNVRLEETSKTKSCTCTLLTDPYRDTLAWSWFQYWCFEIGYVSVIVTSPLPNSGYHAVTLTVPFAISTFSIESLPRIINNVWW